MKTSELTGPTLDWAVAKCEGHKVQINYVGCIHRLYFDYPPNYPYAPIHYSTDWSQGGPIIEREKICVNAYITSPDAGWNACIYIGGVRRFHLNGPTPLIAAMRCFIASKLGDEIEIPEELI